MRNTLCILVLLCLAACGGKSKDQQLALAKDAIAESDYAAATSALETALQVDANSAETRWLLGKVYLETGDLEAAAYELQQAQNLGWTKDDIRPALAQTLLAQGKIKEVFTLDYQDLNPEAAASVLSSMALAALSDNQEDKARALVTLALRKAPKAPQVKLAEASILVHQGDLASAIVLIESILHTTPASGKVWGLKGQVLMRQGKLEEARAAFDRAITQSRGFSAELLARALINLQLQDYSAAQIDATELLEHSPQDPAANYVQGVLHFHNKQFRKSITALTLAEPAAEQFPLVLYYLSMSYLIEEDLNLAQKFGYLFAKSSPNDSRSRKLLAVILLLQDKLTDAREMLQPVLDRDPDDVAALNIMANILLLDNQAHTGLVLYERIMKLQPDWPMVPLRQETSLVTTAPGEEAVPAAAASADNAANFPQTDILSILNFLDNEDFQGAIEAAKSFQYRDLDSLSPYAVLGRVYVAAGNPTAAKDVFDKALKRDPGDPAANQGLAHLALAANDPDAARRYYQTILEFYADDLTTLLQLAALDASQNNPAAMVAGLRHAAAAHRSALEPRLSLASHYLGAGRPDKVAPLFARLSALQQQSPRVLELIALAQLAQKQYDSALITLRQLVDVKPDAAQYHYLLAMAASETGDKKLMQLELLEVIKRAPQHALALIELARIAHSTGAQELFQQYLATLVELAPEAPDVLRLRALAATAKGKHLEALVFSERAFELAPTAQAVLELAAHQTAAGRTAVARNTLQRWLENHRTDVDARLALANIFELEHDLPGASAQYLVILARQPDNIAALKNLAWNLRFEKPAIALETILRAVAIAPDRADLLDTLAVIRHLAGDHAGAERDIQRALKAAPGNLSMRFHHAMIAAALDHNDQAIAILEELIVKDDGSFPEHAEAKKLLAALKD